MLIGLRKMGGWTEGPPEVDAHPVSAEAAVIAESERKQRREMDFSKLMTRVWFPFARERQTRFSRGLFNAGNDSRNLSGYVK
jgi:hypothetical protein